jgi:hypothetical protein
MLIGKFWKKKFFVDDIIKIFPDVIKKDNLMTSAKFCFQYAKNRKNITKGWWDGK